MSVESAERLEVLAQVINDLPNLKPPTNADPGKIECSQCRHLMPVTDIMYHTTGFVKAQDNLCRECRQAMRDLAPIVCVKCQAVIARAEPRVLPSGFRILARKFYHTDACPNCTPRVVRTMLIEAELFCPKSGLKPIL